MIGAVRLPDNRWWGRVLSATAGAGGRSTWSLWVAVPALALFQAACAVAPPAETEEPRPAVEVRATVDRAVATTGDLITWTVTVDHDAELEVELPGWGGEIDGLEEVDRGTAPERSWSGRTIEERWIQLRADLVGSYTLPGVEVHYPAIADDDRDVTVATAPEIPIEVESVLPVDGAAQDIRDLKPLRRVRAWDWRWWAAGAATALLLLGLGWWWRRRLRQPPPAEPPVPPEVLALERLEALELPATDDAGAIRRYYFAISAILREYVEGRFGLNATDLTTEEIVERVGEVDDLAEAESELLVSFLTATDAVRYAGQQPPGDEPPRLRGTAIDFVHRTPPRIEEEEQEEDPAPIAEEAA